MTIFLIDSAVPQQPAFLYATYPMGVTVAALPESPGYTPAHILQADENNGWRPLNTVGAHALICTYPTPVQFDYFALVGKSIDGVLVEVRGSSDGFNASDVQLSPPAPLSGAIAAWRAVPTAIYNSIKYIFSNFSVDFQIKHIAAGILSPLPFLEDGFCTAPLQAEGSHLISHAGQFLGSVTDRVMRPFSLSFGQVDPVEEALFSAMVKACVQTAKGLFFVRDISLPDVSFGWIDKNYKYEPKMQLGLYNIPTFPFTSRAS